MSKEDPTPAEAAAAEALARALEGPDGQGSQAELPEDALEAAALLRYSQDGGALPADRRRAILAELLEDMAAQPERRPERAWRRWLLPLGGLAGALAVAVALVVPLSGPPSAPPRAALPEPGAELLQVQLSSAGPRAGGVEALDGAMRAYRQDLYAALSAHYDADGP